MKRIYARSSVFPLMCLTFSAFLLRLWFLYTAIFNLITKVNLYLSVENVLLYYKSASFNPVPTTFIHQGSSWALTEGRSDFSPRKIREK